MRKKGLSEVIVRAVMSLYNGAKTRVRVGSAYSEEFEVKVGVHQGSVLSPLLFAIVVDVITENARRGVVNELLYADELVIMSKDMEAVPINSRLKVVVRSPTPFGLGRNGCWPFRGSQLPQALPYIFSLCCPLNDRRRAAHSIYKFGRLFSLFPLSCPTLALLCLLILLLLISGNVHPHPGPIFPCSVCAGNVTWWGKSVQGWTCSKWVHLRCSQFFLSKFRALGSSHSWSRLPCRNNVTLSSDSSDTYTSTVQSGHPLY